ncbi:General negative regulator of transcription subunit 2 [Colletotrichum chlorophyti]|uniref:General negative regulator of transcription subunit 2 n=1 Tax=Colletotrichum chlorophyti TaxID=708187 RepID=A0A1Q8RUI4_9PEZI|nr:General negative regulator of transcription subunit 2 [Colletotrichum chlorophyti]
MWSSTASRNVGGGPVPRNQSTPLSAQNAQDELFTPSSARQGGFRFGGQNSAGPTAQTPSNPVDDFPPLNRNANGEIGAERGINLMPSLGFGNQASSSSAPIPQSRVAGNGLLNALSANSRSSDGRSPDSSGQDQSRTQDASADDGRQKAGVFRDDVASDGASQNVENRNPLGAIGNDSVAGKTKEEDEVQAPEAQDPLAGMAPIDKFGMKGLRVLMNNYPSYGALMQGMDPNEFGLNVNSSDLISTQIYSLFDDTPPRPAIPHVRLPECYKVTNVQPIETKIPSFNEETLFWIFYSCTQDIKQQLAAVELHSRNWRWHKKMHFWLTKDEMLMPASLGPHHERGYYIIWDTTNWRKERRELTLHYGDLETNLGQPVA